MSSLAIEQFYRVEIQRSRIWLVVTVLAFCILNLQTVTATGQLLLGTAAPTIKLYHVFFLALGGVVIARRMVVRWRPEILLYFWVVGMTGLMAYLVYGPQPLLVNLLFCAYVAVIGSVLGRELGRGQALRALRIAAAIMMVGVLVKAILYARVFLAFFAAPLHHPEIPFFYGGGPNLEATWIGLAAAFFIGTRYFLPYAAASLAISALYASRVGIVITLLVLTGAAAHRLFTLRVTGAVRLSAVLGAGGAVVLMLVLAVSGLQSIPGIGYVAERFSAIGADPGSTSRLRLWSGAVHVFEHHPFGVGQGNAVVEMEHELATDFSEDNVHNLFLQHLVESGVQGLVVYLLFFGITVMRLVRSRFSNLLLLYACVYLVAGAVEFRGTETIFWFVYALEMGSVDT